MGPLVLIQDGAKGTRISACSAQAEAEGLAPDMKLNDARAMLPNVRAEQHDTASEFSNLQRLAQWMLRYSPSVSIYGDDSFVLDSAGCDHLFGGERAMGQDIVDRFASFGFSALVAFADSVGAAFALVHFGQSAVQTLDEDDHLEALASMPVQALRLDQPTLILLKRLGLKYIGDVSRIPRQALERRFREQSKRKTTKMQTRYAAQSVQMRLDQLCGALAEPLHTIGEDQPFRAVMQCPDLALEHEAVSLALDKLLPDLCAMLSVQKYGGRIFQLTGFRADGGASSIQLALSQPSNRHSDIKRLFVPKLDQIDCGYGIDLFVLEALNTDPISSLQSDMVDPNQSAQMRSSLSGFTDIVCNRLGKASVTCLVPHTSHVPERAQRLNAPTSNLDLHAAWHHWQELQPHWSPRPLRLFSRPERAHVTAELPDSPPAQFIWRHVLRTIIRARGPERILPEWWHDNLKTKSSAAFRDYYDVEDAYGLRYWIFRSTKYVAVDDGFMRDATHPPSANFIGPRLPPQPMKRTMDWFVHGLF